MNWGFICICFLLGSLYRGVRQESNSVLEALVGTVVVAVILVLVVYLALAVLI